MPSKLRIVIEAEAQELAYSAARDAADAIEQCGYLLALPYQMHGPGWSYTIEAAPDEP